MEAIFTAKELTELGFVELEGSSLEDGSYYRWWSLNIGEFQICFTIEYTIKNDVDIYYFELQGENLPKRTTKSDVFKLIQLLNP